MRDDFVCDICYYSTVRRERIWLHYSSQHSGNGLAMENMSCDECDRPFGVPYTTRRSQALADHIARRHGSEAFRRLLVQKRPKKAQLSYDCDVCSETNNRSYAAKNRLSIHIARNHGTCDYHDVVIGSRMETRLCDECFVSFTGLHTNNNIAIHWTTKHTPANYRGHFRKRLFSDPLARCDDCLRELVGREYNLQFHHWLRFHTKSSSGLHLAAELRDRVNQDRNRKVLCDSCSTTMQRVSIHTHWYRMHRSRSQ